MNHSLIEGNETKAILRFSLPLIVGNIFQQLYNVADSIIVGQYLGPGPLAAVGSSFTLMVFLTSVIIGLCMGASVLFAQLYGAKNQDEFLNSVYTGFIFIGIVSIVINIIAVISTHKILHLLRIPADVYEYTYEYIKIIFWGIIPIFIYNFFSSVLRSIGNSTAPLIFLVVSAATNIVLDILFIKQFQMGVSGAAIATVISQVLSAVLSCSYCLKKVPGLFSYRKYVQLNRQTFSRIASYSILTSVQQSIMNLGILMIQGLVNSFGVAVMAAFAAGVKIESFAYMPLQEYGNAFSTYVAQNIGAGKANRVKTGVKSSFKIITGFGLIISALVVIFAPNLLLIFTQKEEVEIISIGVKYLRTTGLFYILIGYLFSFYGYFRAVGKSFISVVLTIVSLGLRVVLAYSLAPVFGVSGIWWAIPIGWLIADITGFVFMRKVSVDNLILKNSAKAQNI